MSDYNKIENDFHGLTEIEYNEAMEDLYWFLIKKQEEGMLEDSSPGELYFK